MKKRNILSLSAFLFRLGEYIRFSPSSDFSASYERKEKKEFRGFDGLLPYKRKVKSALAKTAEQSAVLGFLQRFLRRFFTIRIRSLGVFFFACGFLQIVSYFAGSFIPGYTPDAACLLFGVMQIFLTLLCSFTRGDLADALKKSFLFRGILSPLMGVKDWQIPGGKGWDNPGAMILWGIAVGLLSALVSPVLPFLAALLFALFLFLFFSPEGGVFLCLSCGLFLPKEMLFWLLVLTFVSFLFKCSVGKRSLAFSFMDLAVLFFLLPFLSLKGTWEGSFFLILLYFLASCLMRTLGDLSRLLSVLTATFFVLSAFLLIREGARILLPVRFWENGGVKTFFFVRPTAEMGSLFAMAIPLTLASFHRGETRSVRGHAFVTFFLLVASLFVIKDSAAWLAAILGMMIFTLFTYRSSLILMLFSGLLIVTVLGVLPRNVSAFALRLFGLEADNLQTQTSGYGSLMELFSQESGIWPLLFGAVILFLLYETVRFSRVSTCPHAYPCVLGAVCSAGVFFALSVQHVMPDHRCLMLFLVMLAVPGAATRASVREEVRLPY